MYKALKHLDFPSTGSHRVGLDWSDLAAAAAVVTQLVKNPLVMFYISYLIFKSACNAGGPSSIPGSGRSAGERIGYPFQYSWASLVVQKVTNHPAMWKTWVRSLCWEDPLEEGMTTPPVFLPGEFHGERSLASCTAHEVAKSLTQLCNFHFFT